MKNKTKPSMSKFKTAKALQNRVSSVKECPKLANIIREIVNLYMNTSLATFPSRRGWIEDSSDAGVLRRRIYLYVI